MRAAVCSSYGSPDVVRIADLAIPDIGENELLIRVHASTVNRTVVHIREAKPQLAIRLAYGLRRPRRPVLGTDFAGVVEAVGSDVRGIEPGDRVFGFNDTRMGAHAEYMTLPASAAVAKIPAGVSDEHAAASVEGAHYALAAIERANLSEGQRALVNGGGGAIGSAAVQLLVSRGVEVLAVAEAHQSDLLYCLGAKRVIDYRAQDFTAIGETFDLVYDAVGKTTFAACKELVAPGGLFMATELGPRLENLWLPLITKIRGDKRVIFAFPLHARRHIQTARDELAAGTLRPVIDRAYDLADIVEAHRFVDTGTKTGNVVVNIRAGD